MKVDQQHSGNKSQCSYGFCFSSLTINILMVISEFEDLDENSEAWAMDLDSPKAFNSFWHDGLCHKLKGYGISS